MAKFPYTQLIFVLLLGATGCKEGWTEENKQQYLQACQDSPNASGLTPEQRDAYCRCSMEKVMKHYSSIEEVLINKDSIAVNAGMLQCREQVSR